jgi:hypothetical protein
MIGNLQEVILNVFVNLVYITRQVLVMENRVAYAIHIIRY